MARISVIVADNHEFEVQGLVGVLRYNEEVTVVGEAEAISEAVALVLEKKPDVILLDLLWNRDSDSALKAIRQIREGAPATAILAMSAYDDLLSAAREVGVDRAIHKDYLSDEKGLVSQIKDAYRSRQQPAPPEEPPKPDLDLSPREWEVYELLCDGLTDREIAERLFISDKTVRHHNQEIYGSLGVENRAKAIAFAHSHKIKFPRKK